MAQARSKFQGFFDQSGDSGDIIEVKNWFLVAFDLVVGRNGEHQRIVGCEQLLRRNGGPPDLDFRNRRRFVALDQNDVSWPEPGRNSLERRLPGRLDFLDDRNARTRHDRCFGRPRGAMPLRIASRGIDVELVMRVLDCCDAQTSVREIPRQLFDHRRLAGIRPARNPKKRLRRGWGVWMCGHVHLSAFVDQCASGGKIVRRVDVEERVHLRAVNVAHCERHRNCVQPLREGIDAETTLLKRVGNRRARSNGPDRDGRMASATGSCDRDAVTAFGIEPLNEIGGKKRHVRGNRRDSRAIVCMLILPVEGRKNAAERPEPGVFLVGNGWKIEAVKAVRVAVDVQDQPTDLRTKARDDARQHGLTGEIGHAFIAAAETARLPASQDDAEDVVMTCHIRRFSILPRRRNLRSDKL